jgi:hypothetical protein
VSPEKSVKPGSVRPLNPGAWPWLEMPATASVTEAKLPAPGIPPIPDSDDAPLKALVKPVAPDREDRLTAPAKFAEALMLAVPENAPLMPDTDIAEVDDALPPRLRGKALILAALHRYWKA